MKVKARESFKLHTVRSVPCSPGQYDALKSGEQISIKENLAKEMIRMGLVEEIKKARKKHG